MSVDFMMVAGAGIFFWVALQLWLTAWWMIFAATVLAFVLVLPFLQEAA
jgi:hypothetical protein